MYRLSVKLKSGKTEHRRASTPIEAEYLANLAKAGSYWDRDDIVAVVPEIRCEEHGWVHMDPLDMCSKCFEEYDETGEKEGPPPGVYMGPFVLRGEDRYDQY